MPRDSGAQDGRKVRAALPTHPILAGVDAEILERIAVQGEVRSFASGAFLNHEGDAADFYWILCSGSVRVFYTSPDGFEVTVKIFGAPAAWAEMEVLTGHPHIEDCIAVDRAVVVRLPRRVFEALLEASPRFMKNVLVDTCARFLIAAQNEKALAFLPVPRRLAHLLLAYLRVYGVPVEGGLQIRVPLSQADLANGLGVAKKSITRAMASLIDEGVLIKRGTSYVVRTPERLAEVAGEDLVGVDWVAGSAVSAGRGSKRRL